MMRFYCKRREFIACVAKIGVIVFEFQVFKVFMYKID
jgi:hypothetical protein